MTDADRLDYLRRTADRELRDAMLRYLARIRHLEASLEDVYRTYAAQLRTEAGFVDLVLKGAAQHGSVDAYAASKGFDPQAMAQRGAAEIEHVARMLEIVPDRLSGGQHHYY